jgi:transcriptional regulator with XRE-family HTH domain
MIAVTMKLNTKLIRETIKQKGLTIEQAAEKMGTSRQRLHMILKNESTLLARVDNIAIALELDPKDILM